MIPWCKLIACLLLPGAVFFLGGSVMNKITDRGPVLAVLKAKRIEPLARRSHYTRADFQGYLDGLDENSRNIENSFLKLDLLFPFFYGGALAISLLYLWKISGEHFSPGLCIAPVALAMVSDWTENVTQLHEFRAYQANGPMLSQAWIRVASAATTAKWLFLGASILLLLCLLYENAKNALR